MKKFIINRLAFMLISVFLMSIVSFVLIELPPGDYVSMYIKQLELSGERVDQARIESLQVQYGFDLPFHMRYFKWIKNILLHGDFGRSFQWNVPVLDLLMQRLPFTILLSVSTLLFTFVVAIPIGIYSAIRQYSIGDYITSFIGYIGLAVPNFLLALALMYILFDKFGLSPGGLFSEKYADEAWSVGKVWDMSLHLIVPIVVIGTAGTAALIRTMRATLLDELGKDYVDTARVKGLSESKLLFKYPVRIAFNPILSSVGWLLPAVISGETIVSIVVNLPTLGPVLLNSLLGQDVYLAGSIILIVTVLTLVGTFISDLLLAWSDPRIRYE